jgi:hypothetical protein
MPTRVSRGQSTREIVGMVNVDDMVPEPRTSPKDVSTKI